jgi:methionine sulfoxide reductase heme-binding subunit
MDNSNIDEWAAARRESSPSARRLRRGGLLSGWPVAGWTLLGVVGPSALAICIEGAGESGTRMVARLTARMAAVLIAIVFATSGLLELWPSPFTRWLRANRRQLGFSVAQTMGIHAIAIAWIINGVPGSSFRHALSLLVGDANGPLWAILVLGITGGTLLFSMALTSFDVTARWLGSRRWKWLHRIGIWFVWAQFLGAFARRGSRGPLYLALAGVMLAPLAIRLLALFARQRALRDNEGAQVVTIESTIEPNR